MQGASRTITADHLSDRMKTNLPEFARLEFVLSTPALKDLRGFVVTHRTVQQPKLYQGEAAICRARFRFHAPFSISTLLSCMVQVFKGFRSLEGREIEQKIQ